MDASEDDERDAIPDNHSVSSEDKHAAEEEEGLLGHWKAEAFDDDETVPPPHNQRRAAYILPLTLCLSAVFLGILLTFILRYLSGESVVLPPEILSNDYLLDSRWDTQSEPQTREFYWTIRDHVHSPDGVTRPMLLVNYQFPGPLIEANEGDNIIVHVDNQAANATSIHFHGIYQTGTPFMDGTVGVTQCPIAPKSKFTYEFTVAGQSGTYWWHSHYGAQSSDGLHGPMIIHGRDEKTAQQLEYATDRVILLSDHYHDLSGALIWQYLKPDMENAEPVPNSGLINGRSTLNCSQFRERMCDDSSSHVGSPTFNLERGQSHRLRLINVGNFAEFQVQIDEHELAVTEADGTDLVPTTSHRLHISPAQRYSVVIKADNANSDSFWLRARMITACFTDPPDSLQSEIRAVVQYGNNDVAIPTSKDWDEVLDLECKDMVVSELVPSVPQRAPAKPDAFFYLRSNFEIGAYRLSRGFFNTTSFRPNIHSPTLTRAIDGLASKNSSFSPQQHLEVGHPSAFLNTAAFDLPHEMVIQTSSTQTLDLLISNFDDGNHPLHLHGHKYFVLAQGHGYPPLTYVGADITAANLKPLYDSLDLSNPLRRDTASVEAFGWLLIRVVLDNPGMWAFHCHLGWHAEAGLAMMFLSGTDVLKEMEVPKELREMCGMPGIEKGMGPDDRDYEELAM